MMEALGELHAVAWSSLHTVRQHPKRVAGAVAALSLTLAGGAYALVSIDTGASDAVVREVVENITLAPVMADSSVLSTPTSPTFTLFRTTATKSNDTADTLLKRLGVSDSAAAIYLRRNLHAKEALLGHAGRMVSVETTPQNGLLKLTARWVGQDGDLNFQRLVIEKNAVGKDAGGFSSRIETAPLLASHSLGSGVIDSTLFAATDEAGLPDSVAVQLADLFAGDIDFRRALRKGDRFSVVYEAWLADGELLRSGRLLSAEFVNAGKTYQAMWFQEPSSTQSGQAQGSKGQYYTLDGNSLRKAFLTSPLEFTRVSSGYGLRVHPISNDKRAHKGIDYAAPNGYACAQCG